MIFLKKNQRNRAFCIRAFLLHKKSSNVITVMQSSSGSMIRPQQQWSETAACWTKFLQSVLGPWVAKWSRQCEKMGYEKRRKKPVCPCRCKNDLYKVVYMQVRRRKILCCRCYSCAGCLISGKNGWDSTNWLCRHLMNFAWWVAWF